MKRKLIAALLCMALSASFIGCNSESNKTSEDTKTKVAQNQSSKDKEEYISLETMKAVPKFKLKDINGKEVTNDIFKDKKYTLITFWGTW